MYSGNRLPPLFEFKNERLRDWTTSTLRGSTVCGSPPTTIRSGQRPRMPTSRPTAASDYDPNDCNFARKIADTGGTGPTWAKGRSCGGFVAVPREQRRRSSGRGLRRRPTRTPQSAKPHDRADDHAVAQGVQSFQIISAGADGLYGLGGPSARRPRQDARWTSGRSAARRTTASARENDNLTNFAGGRLD